MKFYWVKSPKWIRYIFPNYQWHYKPSSKVIYLTFDDGPMLDTTDFILSSLRKYNAKATFFCIGENVRKHPELIQKIQEENHSIGNHTQHHYNGWQTDTKTFIEDCDLGEKSIETYVKTSPKIFRPPYGKCTKKQQKMLLEKGYKLIMWSVLSADFDKEVSNEQCLENIIKNTSSGSIIILHDSNKFIKKVKYVLPKVLKHFSELGYEFKRIDSLTQ